MKDGRIDKEEGTDGRRKEERKELMEFLRKDKTKSRIRRKGLLNE